MDLILAFLGDTYTNNALIQVNLFVNNNKLSILRYNQILHLNGN